MIWNETPSNEKRMTIVLWRILSWPDLMSSLFSEAFSEMWKRERFCDGRRWWGWASSPSTPPDGPGEPLLLSCFHRCQLKSYIACFSCQIRTLSDLQGAAALQAADPSLQVNLSNRKLHNFFLQFIFFAGCIHCKAAPASCQHQKFAEAAQCWRNQS